ncbi:hypothetical protein KSS87_014126 [Heliosperma pusillum]|nr:hypothetical protein KSS87_014126 [Heliosperma pusillum]
MPEEDLVDIKFRLYDGSDIGPFRYSSTSTVDMLKERIVSEWPKVFGFKGQCTCVYAVKGAVARQVSLAWIGSSLMQPQLYDELGKTVLPKVANEIKLISFGKILENNKTVGQCRAPFGELAGGVMVMHVVVQPSQAKTKAALATAVTQEDFGNYFSPFAAASHCPLHT